MDYAKPHPIFYKYSERREQSQIYLNYAEPHPIFYKNRKKEQIKIILTNIFSIHSSAYLYKIAE